MARGDIKVLEQPTEMGRGSRLYNVAAGDTAILAGEPVARALGGIVVSACATNAGQVGTDYIVGIAQTDSTQTASAAGSVNILPVTNAMTLIISPKVALTATQATYDAIVGKRYRLDLTAGVYTILASDAAGNACVVMPLDIAKYPGKVAFAFRSAISDLV